MLSDPLSWPFLMLSVILYCCAFIILLTPGLFCPVKLPCLSSGLFSGEVTDREVLEELFLF